MISDNTGHLLEFLICTGSFPGGPSGKEPAKEPTCQCRRPRRYKFDPWVRKILWRRAWPPTPVSSPAEAQGQRSLAGYSPWGHRDAAARRGWSGSACMCTICTGLKSIKQEGPFSRGFYTKKVPFLTNSHLWAFSCMQGLQLPRLCPEMSEGEVDTQVSGSPWPTLPWTLVMEP